MKKLKFLMFLCMFTVAYAVPEGFISPIGFKSNKENAMKVYDYIHKSEEARLHHDGLETPNTLKYAEQGQLSAFKKLVGAKNKQLLQKTIDQLCNPKVNECSYFVIEQNYEIKLNSHKTKSVNFGEDQF